MEDADVEMVSGISHERYDLGIFKSAEGYELRAVWREGDGWARRREKYGTLGDARMAMYNRADWLRANPR